MVSASSSAITAAIAMPVAQPVQPVVGAPRAPAGSGCSIGCTSDDMSTRFLQSAPAARWSCSSAAARAHAVDDQQNAQQNPEVAEIRQGARVGVLIYTRHRFALCASSAIPCDARRQPTRRQQQPWSGRFDEPVDRARAALHRVGRFRPAARRVRHPRLARARAHAARGRHHRRRTTSPPSSAGWRRSATRSAPAGSRGRSTLEDVHLNIEQRLTELVGDAGKRLHTARSRNDQVATDVRLWLRAAIDEISRPDHGARSARCSTWPTQHAETLMPGFTHLQVAQPVSFGHHLMAYFEMLTRDAQRLADCRKRVNRLPLGAAALAGTTFPIDRDDGRARSSASTACAKTRSTRCPIATSRSNSAPRAALVMMHLSRFCEELILWMNPRFGFVELADRFCTGSSIMPQKKNPGRAGADARQDRPRQRPPGGAADADEGPAARLQQGQPGRQGAAVRHRRHARDEPRACSREMLAGIKVNARGDAQRPRCEGYATATDLADYLVKKGVPFRDAHEAVARAVRFAEVARLRSRRSQALRAAALLAAHRPATCSPC